ncbi:NAD-dependent protein deacylase [Corynebacterium choanae]|uniref:protein acetyllysine N-acetyltransferase n=1 Tax=Corynebacterium choanae TaxID=1862358 RepID=A0A3G6JA39_9CORY|nr:NAD-dependent protein deacylase [Corynebacterium choanae]
MASGTNNPPEHSSSTATAHSSSENVATPPADSTPRAAQPFLAAAATPTTASEGGTAEQIILPPASCAQLEEILAGCRRVVFFTGAGISQESGIPVYRNDDTGLWENVNPEELASIASWRNDPAPMWAWSMLRARTAANATPNAAHQAIGRLAADGNVAVTVVTQNIDDLHERGITMFCPPEHATYPALLHVHGSLFHFRCTDCGQPPAVAPVIPPQVTARRLAPPVCDCGGVIRPGVVWFGEPLDEEIMEQAATAMRLADVVIIVGTSGVVMPACQLPLIAHNRGIPLVEISPQPTAFTPLVDVHVATTAGRGIPAVVDLLLADAPHATPPPPVTGTADR